MIFVEIMRRINWKRRRYEKHAKNNSNNYSVNHFDWKKNRYSYTGCNRRNGPDFGRVFLRSNYTDITQNTNIQSSMVTEILAREV